MEELYKQVKMEIIRTLLWMLISVGVAISIYYLVW